MIVETRDTGTLSLNQNKRVVNFFNKQSDQLCW